MALNRLLQTGILAATMVLSACPDEEAAERIRTERAQVRANLKSCCAEHARRKCSSVMLQYEECFRGARNSCMRGNEGDCT